jgi:hypothetical protein
LVWYFGPVSRVLDLEFFPRPLLFVAAMGVARPLGVVGEEGQIEAMSVWISVAGLSLR